MTEQEKRFFIKVDAAGPCWVWTAARMKNGYGVFNVGHRRGTALAHRFAYESLAGPIPEGAQLDHLCRNRACVNPDHLQPVTQQENLRRGAGFVGINARKKKCPKGHALNVIYVSPAGRRERRCGECHEPVPAALDRRRARGPSGLRIGAKLDWPAVREMRLRYADGEPAADLGRRYGVTPQRVRQIIRNEGWKES